MMVAQPHFIGKETKNKLSSCHKIADYNNPHFSFTLCVPSAATAPVIGWICLPEIRMLIFQTPLLHNVTKFEDDVF